MRELKFSFEFFPPKTEAMEARLWETVLALAPLNPAFVSVTYGAGGATRDRTHAIVERLLKETSLTPAAHLTCVSATREEVDAVAKAYWDAGVRHIVALRGDPPGGGAYAAPEGGYRYASELVAGLKAIGDFEISVAAFPEKHPESPSFAQDLDVLKRKIDAGAARAITQYFFDPGVFLSFRDRVRRAGIAIPLVPGIMPIGNFAQAVKFSALCGASMPGWMHERFQGLDGNPERRHAEAVKLALEQCRTLRAEGVEHFHFYTLNRAEMTAEICAGLE